MSFHLQTRTCKEHLSTADGFPWSGSRTLHQWPLLWQQQVVLSFINQVSEKQEHDIMYRIKCWGKGLFSSVFVDETSEKKKINGKAC